MEYSSYMIERKSDLSYYYNENEINSYNYDSIPSLSKNYLRAPLKDSPKGNVELSVEVEIGSRVKHGNTSPEKDNSSVLDVTIVGPNLYSEDDYSNNDNFGKCPVKDLLTALKYQNRPKRQTWEKDKQLKSLSNYKDPVCNSNKITVESPSMQQLCPRKRKLRHPQSSKIKDNVTLPLLENPDKRLDIPKPFKHHSTFERLRPTQDQQFNQSAIVLKPIVNEIMKQPLKVVKNINDVGDHLIHSNGNSKYRHERGEHNCTNKQSHLYAMELPNTHQIYATPNTFDKLKTLYACQNSDKTSDTKLNFCSCNNCEMIGVLMDSQKKPFLNVLHQKKKNSNSSCKERPASEDRKNATDKRTKLPRFDYDSMSLLKELGSRLNSLEQRVTEQELKAVPKEYFKRIIRKLMDQIQRFPLHESVSSTVFKTTATQCSGVEKNEPDLKSKKNPNIPKYRNVQIQQNKRRDYVINRIAVENETKSKSPPRENNNLKDMGTNAMTVISDFFMKKQDEKKTCESRSALDSFLRWGEEIIKPGFDIKTKILNLLDEQLNSFKTSKPHENKCEKCKKEKCEISSKDTSLLTFSKKESSVEESLSPLNSSNIIKKPNLKSEKVYTDQVKPLVKLMKDDQTSTTKNKAVSAHKQKKVEAVDSITNCFAWKQDYLEPLEMPSLIKSVAKDLKDRKKTSQSAKKSGIPVRVTNTPTVDSMSQDKLNSRSREKEETDIPYFKTELKDDLNSSERIFKRSKYSDRYRKKLPKKKSIQKENGEGLNSPSVQIKYISPKAKCWNEDSTVSVTMGTSQDTL